MRKIILFLAVLAVSFSCSNKEDILNGAQSPVEKINIFISQSQSNGLKSANGKAVSNGDTVFVQANTATIMYAENGDLRPMSGDWSSNFLRNDNITSFNNDFVFNRFGDQISIIYPECGYYKVKYERYQQNSIPINFVVKVLGRPGKLGDEDANNWIFRVEKKTFIDQTKQTPVHLLFVYYKFSENILNNTKGEPTAILTAYMKNGSKIVSGFEKMTYWPFINPDFGKQSYYYFVINLDNSVESSWAGYYYTVNFVTYDGIFYHYDIENMVKAMWRQNDGGIKFSVL